MSPLALTKPQRHSVKRSELRQRQNATLRLARGNQVVVISATNKEDEKLLLDKDYFEELVLRLRSAFEALDIMGDEKLYKQILNSAENLEENTRLGKLHSFEEAFGED